MISEFVQALLPSKTFQLGDIAANVCGTLFALLAAWKLDTSRGTTYEAVDLDYFALEDNDVEEDDRNAV